MSTPEAQRPRPSARTAPVTCVAGSECRRPNHACPRESSWRSPPRQRISSGHAVPNDGFERTRNARRPHIRSASSIGTGRLQHVAHTAMRPAHGFIPIRMTPPPPVLNTPRRSECRWVTRPTTTQSNLLCADPASYHTVQWPVETSLEAVAFAEPCRRRRFRAGDLTEPAWLLVLVPPVRTRRADFPQRAPQSALTRSGVIRPSGVLYEDTAVRTTCGSADSSSTADDADSGAAGGGSIEVGPVRVPTGACAHSDAARSTG
jgi:hypothetical protein